MTKFCNPKNGLELKYKNNTLKDINGNIFSIINNIPRFVELENYSSSFGFQWNYFNETQIDFHNNTSITRSRFFRTTRWTEEDLKDSKVLEVGSGSGRFTQILLELGTNLFSFDYSNAVEANAKNNGHFNNLTLCQASVYEIPFAKKYFDKICCLGVLQHTPDVEKSFACMLEHLKPGGEIVVDVYADTFKTKFYSKYFFRFFTKKIKKETLLHLIASYVPLWMPISNLFLGIPLIGKFLAQIIPICNYSKQFPELSKKQLEEWAILDTFDMLSPEYDTPQKYSTLKKWIEKYNLEEIYLCRGDNGFILKAKSKICVA